MRSVLLLTLLSSLPLAAGPLVVLTYDQEFNVSYEGQFHEISFSPGWTIRPHWKYVDGYAYAGGSLTTYATIYNAGAESMSWYVMESSWFTFEFAGVSDFSSFGIEFSPVGPVEPGESIPFMRAYGHGTDLDLALALWSKHPAGKITFSSLLGGGGTLYSELDRSEGVFSVSILAAFEAPEPSYAPVMAPGLVAFLFLAGRRKRLVRTM
ncbi:MAG: hypothetical protein J0L64_27165 [Acidobacteria bacterium]|nr:hypothetical protein [Acidobacteriota bacterium]